MILLLLVGLVIGDFDLSDSVIHAIDKELIKDCGGSCVNTFHELLPEIHKVLSESKGPNGSESLQNFLDALTDKFDSELRGFKVEQSSFFPLVGETSSVSANVSYPNSTNMMSALYPIAADYSPCRDELSCFQLASSLTKCTHTREQFLQIYQSTNRIIHIMFAVLKIPCACIFEGPITICLLGFIPYTCAMWAIRLKALFFVSSGLWKVNQFLTGSCALIGGEGFLG